MSGSLFDTDTISAPLRRQPNLRVLRRIDRLPPEARFTSAITLGELLYGATRRQRVDLLVRIERLVAEFARILAFDEPAARTFGPLKAELEGRGTPLDEADLRIASIALANSLTLVTGNERHFRRVPGLLVGNWLREADPEP